MNDKYGDTHIENKFLYGRENKKLWNISKLWKECKKWGVFYLVGPPASGKTTFLKSLKFEDIRWINDEEMDNILQKFIGGSIFNPSERIIFIEDADLLMNNSYKAKCLVDLLNSLKVNYYGQQRLIVCTINSMKYLVKTNFQILYIKPIKITRKVVKEKAEVMKVKLNKEELESLSTLEHILYVIEELNRIKLYDMVIEDEHYMRRI